MTKLANFVSLPSHAVASVKIELTSEWETR